MNMVERLAAVGNCVLSECETEVLSLGSIFAPVFGLSERRLIAIKAVFSCNVNVALEVPESM